MVKSLTEFPLIGNFIMIIILNEYSSNLSVEWDERG